MPFDVYLRQACYVSEGFGLNALSYSFAALRVRVRIMSRATFAVTAQENNWRILAPDAASRRTLAFPLAALAVVEVSGCFADSRANQNSYCGIWSASASFLYEVHEFEP